MLEIKNLHVSVEGKEIIKGLNLKLETGKVNALMGPNGSGKSTLANTLMGHPKYIITSGNIFFEGEDITNLQPDERAKKGIFLSFQYPSEISGVSISNFLRTALGSIKGKKMPLMEFKELLSSKMKLLKYDEKLIERYLNEGFSGGEKKRTEILQMAILEPKFAILDETDSGLDIDALKAVSEGINKIMDKEKKDKTVLIITHYKRILEFVRPDKLFILIDGKIAKEGSGELLDRLEKEGYGWIEKD